MTTYPVTRAEREQLLARAFFAALRMNLPSWDFAKRIANDDLLPIAGASTGR